VKVLDLPLLTNKTWQSFSVSGDTALTVPVGKVPFIMFLKLQLFLAGNAQSQVMGTSSYQFGGTARKCYEVASTHTVHGALLSDTSIALLVNKGDTVIVTDTTKTEHQFLNTDLAASLWSYSLSAKKDSNYVDKTVEWDTIRTAAYITSYYDARTSTTLVK
jgi:hypothetical protein